MIYSVGCEYAVRALIRLALRVSPGRFCLLRDILEGEDLPQHFVGKIFQTLVRADILISAKGRGGGFALRREPEDITLREITEAIDGPSRVSRCVLGFADCGPNNPCPQHEEWVPIRNQIERLLNNTTLANLANHFAETRGETIEEPKAVMKMTAPVTVDPNQANTNKAMVG